MHDVRVEKPLLEKTDAAGKANRERFEQNGVYAINLMSAPGSGKTSLLERTLERLAPEMKIAVIEGDIQGSADADRLSKFGVPVFQLNTHDACHLDPRQIANALDRMDLTDLDLLVIENVGNLVCPAEFDLGEQDRVMLLSVTEGDDKPEKYPLMFSTADLMLLNKTDLLFATNFDIEKASDVAKGLNPDLDIQQISCRTGDGLDLWIDWLKDRVGKTKSGTHKINNHAHSHHDHNPKD
jgi:hydrogenase nickel incorporation protein HypB